jgi:hypothetical protein
MWHEWLCYSALCGETWQETTVHHVARCGWRATFNSLTRNRASGMVGQCAGRHPRWSDRNRKSRARIPCPPTARSAATHSTGPAH